MNSIWKNNETGKLVQVISANGITVKVTDLETGKVKSFGHVVFLNQHSLVK